MEVVSSARASVLPSVGEVARIPATPAPDAVRTELPAQASVLQTPASAKPAFEKSGPQPASAPDVSRNITIDAQTQEIVLQTISDESGEVLRQVPDRALLRMRAYSREQREAQAEAETERHLSRIA